MSNPRDDEILFRCGGSTWAKYGVPWRRMGFDPRERAKPTFTRADVATCATFYDSAGVLRLAAAGAPRIEWVDLDGDNTRETPGILLEGARTNIVLWNRDLTNAAWTKTNVTAAKDQTGIDGVASSASKITASADNGTCLQAITLASSARFQSCYVKRLVGSGAISMTMDNGSTYTPITVTSAWTRVSIPTQTLADPTVGFRIATNGDSVAIDFVQNEAGTFGSSVIATTTAAVTRAADSLSCPLGVGPQDLTILARVPRPSHVDISDAIVTAFCHIVALGWLDGSAPAFFCNFENDERQIQLIFNTATTDAEVFGVLIPAGTEIVVCVQVRNPTTTGALIRIDTGSGFSAEAGPATPVTAWGSPTVRLGGLGFSGTELYGVLRDVIIARGLFSRAEMLAAL